MCFALHPPVSPARHAWTLHLSLPAHDAVRPEACYSIVYFEKIASIRLNDLSTAALGVMPFLITSACA